VEKELSRPLKRVLDRNRRLAARLVANPRFQSKVSDLRKKWDIPPQGFESEKACSDFYVRLMERADIYDSNPRNPHISSPIIEFGGDLTSICLELELRAERWKDFVQNYLLYNRPGFFTSSAVKVEGGMRRNDVRFNIISDETQDELLATYPMLKSLRQLYEPRSKVSGWPKLERDKKIHELYEKYSKDPKPRGAGSDWPYSKIADELSKDDPDFNLGAENIKKIVSDFKKRMRI